jgi:hypothetical protein
MRCILRPMHEQRTLFLDGQLGTWLVARMGLSLVRHESLVPIKSLVAKDAVNCLRNAVGIRARASKQDSELGRLVNLGSLHSLQCRPICINRELRTDQTIQAS